MGTPVPDPYAEVGARLRGELVRAMVASQLLVEPEWRQAFEDVPRHLFVPFFHQIPPGGSEYRTLSANDPDPLVRAGWLAGVYRDEPLVVRVRDGRPVSSSTQPSLMAVMLAALQLRGGEAVLEVGTGTGYNAALLAHRLCDALVTTVDLDEEITESAAAHLGAAGYRPAVVTGDGSRGCLDQCPYDRVIATCAMPSIPLHWLRQCRPGGLVIAPVATGLVRLEVWDGECAQGRFRRTPAYFISLRGTRRSRTAGAYEPQVRRTSTGPKALENDVFRFVLGLAAGELDIRWTADNGQRLRAVALGAPDGSTASAERDGTVAVSGPRDLWALVESGYDFWQRAGRPGRERFGLTVCGDRQWTWLDSPDSPHRWRLPPTG